MTKMSYSLTHLFLLFILLNFSTKTLAQETNVNYDIELYGLTSSGIYAPSLFLNNQYGKFTPQSSSINTLFGISKLNDTDTEKFQYSYKISALTQADRKVNKIYLHEYYGKIKWSIFDLSIGASEENLGIQDAELSSGGLLFSKNTRPMPKLSIGILNYTKIPFTKGFMEIKGALSHGWFTDNTIVSDILLHHKYAVLRFGGKLPIHFQYGVDHVAQWGGHSEQIGQQPHSIKDYVSIFLGKAGGADALETDQINVLGNHIISQSMRLDLNISDFEIGAYWQNVSEDSPIRFITQTMNIKDGLWGFSIKTKAFPFVNGVLYEYLNTTDQSGPYHDKDGLIYGGADSYFYNGVYQSGWSFYERTIGTPLIFPPQAEGNGMIPVNNRVQAHHVGLMGNIFGYKYKALATFSKNYGIYGKSESLIKKNTAILLDLRKQLSVRWNVEMGIAASADFGKLYNNSVGCQLSIRKSGYLFKY